MKEIILAKNGEIALKGLNRRRFEEVLMRNIKWRLRDFGKNAPDRSPYNHEK